MLIDKLEPYLKKAIADRFHAWELVEILEIPVEDIIEIFEDEILNLKDYVLEMGNIRTTRQEYTNEE